MKQAAFFLILLLLSVPLGGWAEEKKSSSLGTVSLYFENDFLAGTDRDYTSGMKLIWTSSWATQRGNRSEDRDKKKGVSSFYDILPFFNRPGDERAVSVLIGQSIYTPEDLDRRGLIRDDRPYAGYTYLGVAMHRKTQKVMDSLEVDFGIVGRHSYAEDVQEKVHEWIGSDEAKGWKNQLKDEPAVELIYERKWRLSPSNLGRGFGWDFIPHLGGRIGNVSIYGNAGAEFRFGWNLPVDFGTCPIRPGCESNPATVPGDDRRRPFGVHVFLGVDGRAVLRDIFLDGNTWRDSHSVNREYFVADIGAGVGISANRFKVTYGLIYRTKEFDKQNSNGHIFGTLLITFFL